MDGSMTDRAIDYDVAQRERKQAAWEAKLERAYGVFWMFHGKALRDALKPLKMPVAWEDRLMDKLCEEYAEKEAEADNDADDDDAYDDLSDREKHERQRDMESNDV